MVNNRLKYFFCILDSIGALGFWHEQSRADRDDYVTIDFNNIQLGKNIFILLIDLFFPDM